LMALKGLPAAKSTALEADQAFLFWLKPLIAGPSGASPRLRRAQRR
jgi:hypothetical protein